jgi:uncharacterized protein YfaS (alpha-2-macroglobulin family)
MADDALWRAPPREKLVAFSKALSRLARMGRATVRFDMPQFNGTVRVNAVAWSRKRDWDMRPRT